MELNEIPGQPGPITRQETREKHEFVGALFAATPTLWGTKFLVALNVAVFGLMVLRGVSPLEPTIDDLLRFGADYGPLTVSGQWWRVLTAAFVHIGLVHLLLNMWGLWQGGQLAERFYGHGAYLALYLGSAIGGSLTSLAWNPSIVSAGASGAIFGVYGALLAVVVLHRHEIPAAIFADLRKSTVAVVGYNVLFGIATPGIDNAAHLGGLALGLVGGLCLRRPLPKLTSTAALGTDSVTSPGASPRARLLRVVPVVILLTLATVAAKLRVGASPAVRAERHFDLALDAWSNGDAKRAMTELAKAIVLQPDDPRSWSLRGDIVWAGGDRRDASASYRKAIEVSPEYDYAHLRLGWAEHGGGNLDAAYAEFKRAIELDPRNSAAYLARGWVQAQRGRPKDALDDYERAIALDATDDYARWCRAHTLCDLRRYPEALAAFQEFAAKDDERGLSSALCAWTIRARAGEREAASLELRARLEGHAGAATSGQIGSFLLGDLGQQELLDEIRGESTNGQTIELCDAWYFIGVKALLDGEDDRAKWALQRAINTRKIETPMFASAAVELAELER